MTNEKVFQMNLAKVYLLLENKALKKGRTKEEVLQVVCWLTGYGAEDIEKMLSEPVTYGEFFQKAPAPNPNRNLIKGVVCGVRVEEVEDPLMQEIRYLDKLVDELAKGKPMKKILRTAEKQMWICPKCGRTFKNKDQSHYCGLALKTIEDYILRQPEELQPFLHQVNEAIRNALPEAKEKISWSMPTYWNQRNLIQFACHKKHIGLYPGPEAVEAFADRLKDYKTSKGSIQLPYDKPLPLELIAEIARWCGPCFQ